MKTLAIDLGTTFGWALHANGIITSGSYNVSRYMGCQSKPADHIGEPYVRMVVWLHNAVRLYKPEEVCYEAVYRWNSSSAARAYGAYRGILLIEAAKAGIPAYGYSPTAIKKSFTGKGNCKKDVMLAEAVRRYPNEEIEDDNEADALAILDLHLTTTKET